MVTVTVARFRIFAVRETSTHKPTSVANSERVFWCAADVAEAILQGSDSRNAAAVALPCE